MKGQLLAVDFENKKLLNNTQPKSEAKSDKHYLNHTLVCDGAVTLFTTTAEVLRSYTQILVMCLLMKALMAFGNGGMTEGNTYLVLRENKLSLIHI